MGTLIIRQITRSFSDSSVMTAATKRQISMVLFATLLATQALASEQKCSEERCDKPRYGTETLCECHFRLQKGRFAADVTIPNLTREIHTRHTEKDMMAGENGEYPVNSNAQAAKILIIHSSAQEKTIPILSVSDHASNATENW